MAALLQSKKKAVAGTRLAGILADAVTPFFEFYRTEVECGIRRCLAPSRLEAVADVLWSRLAIGRNLFCFGNGGSCAQANFFADQILSRRPELGFSGFVFKNPDLSFLQLVSHQQGYGQIFAVALRQMASPGDGVVLISASGNSENCLIALREARLRGLTTLSFSGFDGGVLGQQADYPVVFPLYDQQAAEDVIQIFLSVLSQILGPPPRNLNRPDHVQQVLGSLAGIEPTSLAEMAADVARAFDSRHRVFVWAPEGGGGCAVSEHIAHNLQWDALSELGVAPLARVMNVVGTVHFTGLTNDREYRHTFAEQLKIHGEAGDVLLVLAFDPASQAVNNLLTQGVSLGLRVHLVTSRRPEYSNTVVCHVLPCDEQRVFVDLAQICGHILGRLVRLALMLIGGDVPANPSDALQLLIGCDLAQLRIKDAMNNSLDIRVGARERE